jgi:hypothetical protein
LKTVDDEYVNTNCLVDIRVQYIKEHNYTLLIGTAVTGQQYFLMQQEGVAAGMLNEQTKKLCRMLNREE